MLLPYYKDSTYSISVYRRDAVIKRTDQVQCDDVLPEANP